MANRHAGQSALEVDGKTYTLVFDVNSMCEVEYVLDKSTDAILRSLVKSPPFHVVRALLWGGLRTHHPDIDLPGAGTLMEKLGGVGPSMNAVGDALTASFPDAEVADGKASPRKGAKAGTGRRS